MGMLQELIPSCFFQTHRNGGGAPQILYGEVAYCSPGRRLVSGCSVADGTCIAKAKTSNIANSNNLKAKSPAYEMMIV